VACAEVTLKLQYRWLKWLLRPSLWLATPRASEKQSGLGCWLGIQETISAEFAVT
jgi:hypothetical protein